MYIENFIQIKILKFFELCVCTLCLSKNITLYIVIQFCQFLAETYQMEFKTKHIFTAHPTSLHMFTLYLEKN